MASLAALLLPIETRGRAMKVIAIIHNIYIQLHTYYVFPWGPYMYTSIHEDVSLKVYNMVVVAA